MADRPIELALNSTSLGHQTNLVSLVDRLLLLLAGLAPDYPALDPRKFRDWVNQWRRKLRHDAGVADAVASGERLVTECETYFRRVRAYEGEREAEFGEVVGVMREVLGTLRGGADAFEKSFAQSASQFAQLGDIADIRELRHALRNEVDTLKRLVKERSDQDGAAFRTLSKRVEKLEANLSEAREEAAKDGLTGLANRRTFDRTLARFMARARGGGPFTLAMVDVDDFKQINDEHGHPVGDRVLVCIANLIVSRVRANDFVARYGGEEFAIILDHVGVSSARPRLMEIINHLAKSYSYEQKDGPRCVSFTFSIGATEFAHGDSAEDVVKRADDALYRAKRKGKHCLEISTRTLLQRMLG